MSVAATGACVWMDGTLLPANHGSVDVSDRGFSLGDGLFETMLWTGRSIRFLDDHMNRLTASAQKLGIDVPLSVPAIKHGLETLGHSAHGKRAVVRLTLTRGSGARGLAISADMKPLLMATIADYAPPTSAVALVTVDIRRNASAPTSAMKTLSYLDNVMALAQAKSLGGDDGIMLGDTGHVACATSANLVIFHGGKCLTPDVADGALAGIVRGRLLAAGKIEVARITPDILASCEGAALTNALIGVRAVESIDGRPLSSNADWCASWANLDLK